MNVSSETEIKPEALGSSRPISAVSLRPFASTFASLSSASSSSHDIQKGKGSAIPSTSSLVSFNTPVHNDSINHLTFNSQGTLLLSASSDGTCRLWKIDTHSHTNTESDKIDELDNVEASSSSSSFTYNQKLFKPLTCLQILKSPDREEFISAGFNYDGDAIFGLTREGSHYIWRKKTRKS